MWMRRSPTRSDAGAGRAAAGIRRRLVTGLLTAATIGLAGCPFDPRPVPAPCDPQTDINCRPPAPFESPLAPENVRNNIRAALQAPTVDPNYLNSLNEQFRYLPDLDVLNADPDCFQNWNRTIEVDLMRTVLEASVGIRPTMVVVSFPLFMDSGELNLPRLRYNVRYEVALTFADSSLTPPMRTDRYGATAKWDFVRDDLNSSWTLERWEDITPTSGFLGSLGLLRLRRGPCSG